MGKTREKQQKILNSNHSGAIPVQRFYICAGLVLTLMKVNNSTRSIILDNYHCSNYIYHKIKHNMLFHNSKVVQASHHQTDASYDVTQGTPCSYISLMSIRWSFFKLPSFWDLTDLYSTLQKGD